MKHTEAGHEAQVDTVVNVAEQLATKSNGENHTEEADDAWLASIRLRQDYAETVSVQKVLLTVPFRKPNKDEFFRVHPEHRLDVTLVEFKTEREPRASRLRRAVGADAMADDLATRIADPHAEQIARIVKRIDEIINERTRALEYKFAGYEQPSTYRRAPIAMLSKAFCASVNIACEDDYLLLGVDWDSRPFAKGISGQTELLQTIKALHPFHFVSLLAGTGDRAFLDWELVER